jgi:DNA-binding transcriptional ArsR family regulator
MLDTLITSKTRLKLLLKFFSNRNAASHLRGLAKEMDESTNAVRLELNKLSEAGILVSQEEGNTIQYKANAQHPLFPELSSLVRKYLGLDKVVENLVQRLGDVKLALVTGDYARGKDSGIINLLVVGNIDMVLLDYLVNKTQEMIKREIDVTIVHNEGFQEWQKTYDISEAIVVWGEERR